MTDTVKGSIDELEQKITHCLITGLYCFMVASDKEFIIMLIASFDSEELSKLFLKYDIP